MADASTNRDTDGGHTLVEYGIEDRPSSGEAVPLGVQHLLAMFLSTVALPLVIAGSIGLGGGDTQFIVQMALLVAGIATIVQVYPIGPVGARLPIVMGTSAIFVAPLIDIGNTFGLAAIFGAVIVASPVEVLIGYFFDDVRGLFPPLVTGIVVMLVGLTLIPTAMQYAAGGPGAETYGNLENLGLAALVFLVALLLNQFTKGIASAASVLVAVLVGYVAAAPLGLLDLSGVADAGWFALPIPLQYGLEFEPSAILLVAFAYVVTAMETIGDISGTTESVGRDPTSDEMSGGLVADGVMSAFAGLFNAFPNTSFSQNVGLIGFTGVASRFVVAITGVLLIVLGLVPKVAAAVSAMPEPVLGGAAIILFGMIISIGLRLVSRGADLNRRNLTIIAVSITLGLGVEVQADILQNLPSDLQLLVGSGLISGGVTALVLNAVLPAEESAPVGGDREAETLEPGAGAADRDLDDDTVDEDVDERDSTGE